MLVFSLDGKIANLVQIRIGKACARAESTLGPFGCAQGKLRRRDEFLWILVLWRGRFLWIFDRGGVIMYYVRHRVLTATLCFAVKFLHFN